MHGGIQALGGKQELARRVASVQRARARPSVQGGRRQGGLAGLGRYSGGLAPLVAAQVRPGTNSLSISFPIFLLLFHFLCSDLV